MCFRAISEANRGQPPAFSHTCRTSRVALNPARFAWYRSGKAAEESNSPPNVIVSTGTAPVGRNVGVWELWSFTGPNGDLGNQSRGVPVTSTGGEPPEHAEVLPSGKMHLGNRMGFRTCPRAAHPFRSSRMEGRALTQRQTWASGRVKVV
jgi:hypothetical protein